VATDEVATRPRVAVTIESVRRRYLILLALRWFPTGMIAPLLVLLLTRDLPLGQVGALLATYGVTTAVLELPTGGLADVIGRRPVLMFSSVAAIALYALLATFESFPGLFAAMFVGGVARALDSGPLESWFVDRSLAIDPDVDLRAGLSLGGAVDGAALAVGSIIGGIVPALFDARLVMSVWIALALQVVHLVAVFFLLIEPRVRKEIGLSRVLGSVPATVGDSLNLVRRGRSVRGLLVGASTIGVALVAVESLWQPRFVALLDAPDTASAFLGVLLAVAFAGSALGAALAPRAAGVIERFTPASATVGQMVSGGALIGLAATTWVPLAAVLFVGFYLTMGVTAPLRDELMHRQVPSERRTTMLSAESLVFQAGGFVAALTFPALAEAKSTPVAWTLAGALLAVGALAYRSAARHPPAMA
jgi:MFS family permease